jgi:CHAT domain-containing protein
MFSALRLADGPLLTYDLEQLTAVPETIVLSACDGLAGAVCGDDLLGMASALLHLGTATVIGSLVRLPDEAARPLMRDLHGRLADGQPPAVALCATQAAARDDHPRVLATAASLVCLGAGWPPVPGSPRVRPEPTVRAAARA